MRTRMHRGALALAAMTCLTACGGSDDVRGPAASAKDETPPHITACPAGVPATVTCYGGQDSQGAYYMIAKPANWSGILVMHAHGGPDLGAPSMERAQSWCLAKT